MGLIRTLLALAVVFTHAGDFPLTSNKFVGGTIAVQSFYIVSGFYMALVLNKKYAHARQFYINRFIRLYPTYWAILIMVTLAMVAVGRPSFVSSILDSDVLHWDGKILMLIAN